MLSRIADSMFWLARYMERAEDTARILDVNYHMLLEQSATPYRLRWDPLVIMAGEQQRFFQFYTEANAQTVYDFLAFRSDNPNSIVQCITKARENARTIRDRISREMWEDINGLYHSVTRFDPAEQISSGPHRFCDAVKFGSHRFFGVTDATLPHDEGWDFLRIGWSLERAEMTARLVDLQFQSLLETPLIAGTADNHQWMAVLKSVGAYEVAVPLAHRARTCRRDVDPARQASALDSLQHYRTAIGTSRHQWEQCRLLCQRGRTSHWQGAGRPPLRHNLRYFSSRTAQLPFRPAG